MIRTQIQLSEAQARRVRDVAHREGVSMAEVIRRCVDQSLEADAPDRLGLYEQASRLVGRYQDREGAPDLGEGHDEYLEGSFG